MEEQYHAVLKLKCIESLGPEALDISHNFLLH